MSKQSRRRNAASRNERRESIALKRAPADLPAAGRTERADDGMLTERFERALAAAHGAHRRQKRRDGSPYIGHLLAVASLVMQYGGDEDQVIAALLHDVREDCDWTDAQVRGQFGDRVAEIVDFATERPGTYRARKTAYAQRLADAPPEALLVVLADKFHNADCSLNDGGGGANFVWYNALLLEAFGRRAADMDEGGTRLRRRYERLLG